MTGAALVIGVAEALIYYNMGRSEEDRKFSFRIPPGKEMAKTVGVVLVTSILTGLVTDGIQRVIKEHGSPKLASA